MLSSCVNEQPIRDIIEFYNVADMDGSLQLERERFQKWEETENVKSPLNKPEGGICPVTSVTDKQGNEIRYCSIPQFAAFLNRYLALNVELGFCYPSHVWGADIYFTTRKLKDLKYSCIFLRK